MEGPVYSDFAARGEFYDDETGHAFASMREHYFHSEVSIVVPKLADAERATALFARWKAWFETPERFPLGVRWESEVPFAHDPMRGTWRRLTKGEQRGYTDAAEGEIVGTADVVGWASDRVIVLDDKTGKRSNVGKASENEQIAFLGTAAAAVAGVGEAAVGLVFPVEDPVGFDQHAMHVQEFSDVTRWLHQIVASVADPAPPAPRAGEHCFGCVIENVCPAKAGDDREFEIAFAAASDARHLPVMGRRARVEVEPEAPRRRRRADDAAEARDIDGAEGQVAEAEAARSAATDPRGSVVLPAEEFDEFAPEKGRGGERFPKLPGDVERIVESIYKVDIAAIHRRVEASLRVGEGRADYATLNEALDEAEDVARTAHLLYLAAKIEREKWTRDAGLVMAKIRQEAVETLQSVKEKGDKRITEADVDAKMATMYDDEVRHYGDKSTRLKGFEEHTLHLVEICKSRCRSLQVMMGALRR